MSEIVKSSDYSVNVSLNVNNDLMAKEGQFELQLQIQKLTI